MTQETFDKLRTAIEQLGPFQCEGTVGLDMLGYRMDIGALAPYACAVKIIY